MCTLPYRAIVASAAALSSDLTETSALTPSTSALVRQPFDGLRKRRFLDVAEHDLHARLREGAGNAESDSRRRAGDERGPSRQVFHPDFLNQKHSMQRALGLYLDDQHMHLGLLAPDGVDGIAHRALDGAGDDVGVAPL